MKKALILVLVLIIQKCLILNIYGNNNINVDYNSLKSDFSNNLECRCIEDICYIKINSFENNTYNEFKNIVKNYSGKEKFMIDLRNNKGGYIDQSAECAALFVKKNTPFLKISYDNGEERIYCGKKEENSNLRLVVLVNAKTASSAEAFALSLKGEGAVLVGEKTYGKNSVQRLIKRDFDIIKYTVGKYIVENADFPENGIIPNIIIHNTSTIIYYEGKYVIKEIDNQFNKAIELFKEV